MRKVISDFTKIPYNEVILKRTEKGKPFLVSKLILKPKFLSLESNHFTVKSKLCFMFVSHRPMILWNHHRESLTSTYHIRLCICMILCGYMSFINY